MSRASLAMQRARPRAAASKMTQRRSEFTSENFKKSYFQNARCVSEFFFRFGFLSAISIRKKYKIINDKTVLVLIRKMSFLNAIFTKMTHYYEMILVALKSSSKVLLDHPSKNRFAPFFRVLENLCDIPIYTVSSDVDISPKNLDHQLFGQNHPDLFLDEYFESLSLRI